MGANVEALVFLFVGFLILLAMGFPLAFSLGGLSVLSILIFWGNVNVINMLLGAVNTIVQNPTFSAAPLFIFMGVLLEKSGISDTLFDSMYIVMGRMKGGLAIATVVICTLLSATTGVIAASITIMTLLALPAMIRYKYNFNLAAGSIMATGGLGQLLPPSVIMIVYAGQAQISVGRMFAGGIGSGLMMSALFIIYIVIRTTINPKLGPPISKEEASGYSGAHKIGLIFKSVMPTILLVFAVIGSIMFGIASPTEASAVGCVGALLLVIINRRFSLKMLIQAGFTTTLTMGAIFFIITAAAMFSHVFLAFRGGVLVHDLITGLPFDKWGTLIVILVIVFIMGFLIDSYGLVMIGVPIFLPIVIALGFDPLWFSVLFIVMMVISMISPPFSYAAFYVKNASKTDVNIMSLYNATWWYLLVYIVGVVLLIIFPGIITFIPSLIFG